MEVEVSPGYTGRPQFTTPPPPKEFFLLKLGHCTTTARGLPTVQRMCQETRPFWFLQSAVADQGEPRALVDV